MKGLYKNHLFADVELTLKKLTEQGYHLYLATAKPEVYARQILEHFNLLQSPPIEAHSSAFTSSKSFATSLVFASQLR